MRTRADDIARARGGVFDDDHPLAYTGGGIDTVPSGTPLPSSRGRSTLSKPCDPELRERRSNLRSNL